MLVTPNLNLMPTLPTLCSLEPLKHSEPLLHPKFSLVSLNLLLVSYHFIGDSTPNTARALVDPKKDDLKGIEQKHALTKRRNSKDGNIIYDYHGPTNSYIQQILEDLQSRTDRSFMKFCAIKKLQQLSQDFDEFLKKKLPLWMVESKGPLAINSDSIILILLMLGTSTYFAVRIEVSVGFCFSLLESPYSFSLANTDCRILRLIQLANTVKPSRQYTIQVLYSPSCSLYTDSCKDIFTELALP